MIDDSCITVEFQALEISEPFRVPVFDLDDPCQSVYVAIEVLQIACLFALGIVCSDAEIRWCALFEDALQLLSSACPVEVVEVEADYVRSRRNLMHQHAPGNHTLFDEP